MIATMNSEKINRLLRLITVLNAGQARSPDELAAQLGITRRTLFRDLNTLKSAGIDHYFDPSHGYRVGKSSFLPAVNLTVLETLGLLVLGKTAAAQPKRPMMSAALSAINKLILSIPAPLRDACSDVVSRISINPGQQVHSDRESAHYAVLQRCIDEGRACELTYGSPGDTTPATFTLEPYALHFSSRAWYVLGRSDAHREVRIFKLMRIGALHLLDRRFRKPRRFAVEDKIGQAWQLIAEGKVHAIELEFSPRVATNIAEVQWHPSQRVRMLPGGGCRVSFKVDGLNEIAWWICSYADHVKVIRPKALALRVKQMHQRAAGQYVK